MRFAVAVVGVVIALLGLLFFLQGIGLVGGSSMTGEMTWAVAGPVIALVGVGIVALSRRVHR